MADFKHKSTDSLFMSDDDLALMQKYTEAYNNATDDAGRNAAHDAAEQLRAKYGYSGGADGSGYIKTGQALGATGETYGGNGGGYQYDADGSIAALREKIMNRAPFSYDAGSDPLYQQYRKQYTREAGRSAEDVLGKAAALTGGMPSTAAITASQQASDYQMARMNDKIPELQQLAYSMYLKDLDADYDTLGMLTDAENAAYNRYLAQRDYEYGLSRDAIEDARYADELAYERNLAAQKLAQQGSKSGGGPKEYKPDITYAQVVSAIKRANEGGMPLTAKEKEAYEYWMGEPWNGEEESAQTAGAGNSDINRIMSTVMQYIQQGLTDRADELLTKNWDSFSDAQKEQARSALKKYGYDVG